MRLALRNARLIIMDVVPNPRSYPALRSFRRFETAHTLRGEAGSYSAERRGYSMRVPLLGSPLHSDEMAPSADPITVSARERKLLIAGTGRSVAEHGPAHTTSNADSTPEGRPTAAPQKPRHAGRPRTRNQCTALTSRDLDESQVPLGASCRQARCSPTAASRDAPPRRDRDHGTLTLVRGSWPG